MKKLERFILDDGEIRNCSANIAKMSLIECFIFRTFMNNSFISLVKSNLKDAFIYIAHGFIGLFTILVLTIGILPTMIIATFVAHRKSIKEVKECEEAKIKSKERLTNQKIVL